MVNTLEQEVYSGAHIGIATEHTLTRRPGPDVKAGSQHRAVLMTALARRITAASRTN
jgi:hypothetical protein